MKKSVSPLPGLLTLDRQYIIYVGENIWLYYSRNHLSKQLQTRYFWMRSPSYWAGEGRGYLRFVLLLNVSPPSQQMNMTKLSAKTCPFTRKFIATKRSNYYSDVSGSRASLRPVLIKEICKVDFSREHGKMAWNLFASTICPIFDHFLIHFSQHCH